MRYPLTVFYLEDEATLLDKVSSKVKGKVLQCERLSSRRQKYTYEVKNVVYGRYLEDTKRTVAAVGDFVKSYLPRLSGERGYFDFLQKWRVEFLDKYEAVYKLRVKTDLEEREVDVVLDLPSHVFIPRILYRAKGRCIYIIDHLGARISFVIGNPESPKADLLGDALEEFWHVAIHFQLIARLNQALKEGLVAPTDRGVSQRLLYEGEVLARLFAQASLPELARRGYTVLERDVVDTSFVAELQRLGLKKALKRVGRRGFVLSSVPPCGKAPGLHDKLDTAPPL